MNSLSSSMPLKALLKRLPETRLVSGGDEVEVSSVALDSRTVHPGALFVALSGSAADGMDFVTEAISFGAVAVAVAEDAVAEACRLVGGAPVVACEDPRFTAAHAAAEVAGRPSESLTIVAVTGTSGKTTTTYILESIFAAAGYPSGVLGTIEYRFADRKIPSALTTPDAVVLQGLLREMCDAGVTHVALEASSHALEQGRVDGTSVAAAIYTNLTRDHLDYHGDAESYAAAKARLFEVILPASAEGSLAVLNAADEAVAALGASLAVPTCFFGPDAEVRCENISTDLGGIRGTLWLGSESCELHSPLVGQAHLENLMGAAAAAWKIGVSPDAIARGIAACAGVPGRLEKVDEGQKFPVLVDYAHKPDALARTLETLRELTTGRLIVSFGCGGDRDRGKRGEMGALAARLADLVVLTSDNPRTEDPEAILQEIETGVQREGGIKVEPTTFGKSGVVGEYVVLPERRSAIRLAVATARADDVVLIAGKGHEDYQIVGTEKFHLDDREEVRRALGECV
ncbi:MAG: UDP-N-acetylmuramoyl-L-alanyl-D-glutamate--2,6-diaminopimelate ligase [Candidatus Binatia bacterium]|nr:UDP-N-acetylmuramoyl-L-alanyl-D-glutamate--2,6-diaminopimelate ligase [Candidatus Binatia bacterium]MDG2011711.1 UDP-N-acetylmuramoyl-L-alanyl-D-glutamate--2,6-diaminopimelate ligase [Candidatus Binatia bacterium]